MACLKKRVVTKKEKKGREILKNKKKRIFLLNNKSKNMFLSIVCTFGYSWSLPFQVTIKKNRGHTMPENIRFASSEHFDAL